MTVTYILCELVGTFDIDPFSERVEFMGCESTCVPGITEIPRNRK